MRTNRAGRAGQEESAVDLQPLQQLEMLSYLGTTSGSTLHRARLADGSPVLAKRAEPGADLKVVSDRLRRERDLLESLGEGALLPRPLAFFGDPVAPTLVLDDRPGELLDAILDSRSLSALESLAIAADMARGLAELHSAKLIHGDLRPANVLVELGQGLERARACIVDLSRASREGPLARTDAGEDLAYLSPEWTGRIGREVDGRSDLYSLGVLLYRMLAGQLPFSASDPLEWVHCHIARQPRPLADFCAAPRPASDIAMQLLAKLPEERYQSAQGLAFDLEECLKRWGSGDVRPFALGTRDVPERFQLPGKLYGRAAELDALLRAFRRTADTGSPGLALIAGHSGIGKSSLVNELRHPLAEARAHFGSGKFERDRRGSPHAALAKALGELVQQILSESEAEVARWRTLLLDALGRQGQLIVDLVPQLALLVGPQPPVVALPPKDSQHRFERLFQRFLGALAVAQHPIVLFLDDLQWIDPATLSLLAHVARHPDTHHLLLLGAYRDNEVDPSHPLARAIERLRDEGVAVDTIVPEPLSSDDVSHLVADTLHCEPSRCEALASLVHAKTEGNPLFFTQFLSALHEEGLLAFHRERREWTWDLAGIQVRQHADSVVKLMAAKFRQLPEPTQRVLRLAGCLGHGLDLETLALLSGQSLKETEEDLSEAIERGIVRRGVGGTLRFVHDRVQEAAYALIPPNDRARVHLQIGRLLAAHEGGALGERVFDVVSQFRRGAPLLEAQERIRLAELELEAGRRAAASMAHRSAVQHFAEGQTFLPADRWQSHYALSYALALERARCEWLSGDFAAAESSIAALMREARARAERTDVYRLRIDLLTTLNETEDCVRTALEACAELFGLEVPLHPSPEALEKAVGAVLQQLHGRNVDELAELPAMTDPDMQALLALISSLAPTAYFLDPLVESIMACEIVRRSLLHGNSPHSSHGYMSLALILGFRLDRWDEALQFTRLACRLADKYAGGSEVATYFLAGMLEFQLCPLYEAVDRLRFAWQAAVDGGDTNHGCYAGWGLVGYRLMSGEPLTNVAEEARVQFEFARSVNYVEIRDAFLLTARFIESLRGNTERLGSLDGPDFDSGALESRLAKSSYPHGPESYHLNRAFGEFLAGNYAAALEASDRARDCLPDGPINYTEGHRFFRALAAAGRHDEVPPEERSPLLGALHDSVRSLRAQARRNPATFGPRHALVAAEVARIEGRDIDALRGYEEAISSAREGGFVHLEGMASEAAARFHRQRGWMTGAAAHLRAAHAAYSHWGAMAKVKALEVEHPELRPEHPGQTPAAGRAGIPQLDFLAAARASQAISGQTDLARLLDTLLRTVLESACAQAGWLILASGESLSLAARATANEHGIEVEVFPEPPGYMAELPDSILSYARRSRGPVVLGDAAVPNPFSTDEALRRRGARSVLCLPIIRQGILTALLYLENRLLPGLFTPERLALLELLATQAAISLELGQHKKQLTELVTRRTEELTRANESLRNANRRLEQAHRQLLHSEKMASIGQLAAGVAHEINNPVACISSNLGTLDSYLDDVMRVVRTYQECDEVLPPSHQAKVRAAKEEADLEQVHDDLGSLVADTKHALDRVKKIVFALRSLAHVGESEWQLADIRPGLESTLNLLRNELGRKAVVVIEFGETPPLECLPSDLNQVFMNVLMNAAQAISGRGTITVRTGRLGEEVWVEVSDTGQGIAPENMKRIFDPFFTTKPVGEGTGLGLSLSYGIVEKHHGRIEVASEPGQGTRFRIWLPVRQPAADAA